MRDCLNQNRYSRILLVGIVGLCLIGCNGQEPLPGELRRQLLETEIPVNQSGPPEVTQEELDAQAAALGMVSDREWVSIDSLPWTYAEVQYRGGVRVSFSKVTVQRSDIAEFKQFKVIQEDVIDRDFSGNAIPPRMIRYESLERPTGELTSFKYSVTVDGKSEFEMEGRVIFGQLEYSRRDELGKSTRHKLAFPKETWGRQGLLSLLQRSPMQPGQVYRAQVFLPQFGMGEIIPIQLEAKQMDLTTLASGQVQELLMIEAQFGKPETGVKSRLWVDASGRLQKSMTLTDAPILQLQVDLATVQRLADQAQFGSTISRQFELTANDQPLPESQPLKLRAYSLDVDPFQSFLITTRQQVRSTSASHSEITLGEVNPTGNTAAETDRPDESMLADGPLIPTEHPFIAELANELLGQYVQASEEQRAEVLRQELYKTWTLTPRSAEIASTLEAARSRTGGNIEAACLLAAMLRQQKIPARLVAGLLIDAKTAKASFHVWTQAWVNQTWVELDATQQEPIGTRHLIMAVNSGAGNNPYQLWMPTLKVIRDISDISLVQRP
ncbi:MAG TPA: hypothetical protein DCF63_07665 [Planctomycetaceae bacterium]|nr:hypothetical protein [Planctomycetaceae bacterium]